jgi:hypothetical protein
MSKAWAGVLPAFYRQRIREASSVKIIIGSRCP